ncbi:MAG: ferritin family protein [Deltaproteobacteria bacterium]|nr:ferritin family protein [Deltaproteobacteria bacterium]
MNKLDFDKLSLQDALDLAIIIEEDARDRYEELADQLEKHRTADAARFFKAMVANEDRHAEQLKAHRKQVCGDVPVKIDRSLVPELETTDYDEARAFMSPHKAFEVAYANETRAHNFYALALKKVKDAKVKQLFTTLVAEEKEHQAMIKAAMAKLPPEDQTNPDDFGDDPVAQ